MNEKSVHDMLSNSSMEKRRERIRSCKLRITCFETESFQNTPALRATPPPRGISDEIGVAGIKDFQQ
jgi:hypothetical protein